MGAFLFLVGGARPGFGAPILLISGGELIGATGVEVGGVFYDVALVDGSCFEVFSGCDDASDFAFTTQASAADAAQALLDQVFVDGPAGSFIGFDTLPELTHGCSNSLTNCLAWVPYSAPGFPVMGAWNKYGDSQDLVYGPAQLSTTISLGVDIDVWARFTPAAPATVPEPSALVLLGSGIAAVTAMVKRRRK
jgi:hypothetical protein